MRLTYSLEALTLPKNTVPGPPVVPRHVHGPHGEERLSSEAPVARAPEVPWMGRSTCSSSCQTSRRIGTWHADT